MDEYAVLDALAEGELVREARLARCRAKPRLAHQLALGQRVQHRIFSHLMFRNSLRAQRRARRSRSIQRLAAELSDAIAARRTELACRGSMLR